jgi:hypothetical protein
MQLVDNKRLLLPPFYYILAKQQFDWSVQIIAKLDWRTNGLAVSILFSDSLSTVSQEGDACQLLLLYGLWRREFSRLEHWRVRGPSVVLFGYFVASFRDSDSAERFPHILWIYYLLSKYYVVCYYAPQLIPSAAGEEAPILRSSSAGHSRPRLEWFGWMGIDGWLVDRPQTQAVIWPSWLVDSRY